ncbi:MAG: hypothetical protein R6W75_07375 [Smithellaceae bacterium]
MTDYLLIIFCVIIILSYIFDITSKYTKIPGVILLILTGMAINVLADFFGIHVPNLSVMLPFMGTLGLILVVLESSLDLSISADKRNLILASIASALLLFFVFVGLFTWICVSFLNLDIRPSMLNSIPLAVISSTVAISAAGNLSLRDREFITYESAISVIIGILVFDFVLLGKGSIGVGVIGFIAELIVTVIASILLSTGLAVLLHKINHSVKYIVIMTAIVLVYASAKLIHMPSLLVVLIFGLIMNNTHFFKNKLPTRFINFDDFITELTSFRYITGEISFVIRSFFFILFGYYTSIADLLNLKNVTLSLFIVFCILLIRALFLLGTRHSLSPLLFFAPRGLITILLFLSIPESMMLPFMNEGIISQVIFITIIIMMTGNIFYKKTHAPGPSATSPLP